MSESEECPQLNRLISGELSPGESLELMRRMVREPDLRQQFETLSWVDELLRRRHFSTLDAAGQLAGGCLPPARRQEQVQEILRRTSDLAGVAGRRRPRTPGRLAFRRRVVPTIVAVAALVTVGIVAVVYLPGDRPRQGAFQGPVPIDAQRVARLKGFQDAMGNVLVISPVAQGAGGEWLPVDAKGPRDVVVRVTVVRFAGQTSERWAVDALLPRGRLVELVTETGSGRWPESLKLLVAPGDGERLPVTVQAKLSAEAQVVQTVRVGLSQPERVADVRAGEARFEIYVQAETEPAAGQVM